MDNTVSHHNSPKKVLIAEDEETMAKVMENKLQKAGFDAHAVFNGNEAMAELESGNYSLVLLDLMMPEKNGWDVMTFIKDKGINTKVIVTSNLSQDEDKVKAKEYGAVGFLVKADSSLASIVQEVESHF